MSLSDWHSLGEVPYRKFPIYEAMGWADDIQIEDFTVCGATFGGPLAFLKSNRKATHKTVQSAGSLKPILSMYTSSGNKIVDIDWDNRKVAGMGWSDREELIVVLEDGNVVMYDIRGKLVHSFLIIDFSTQGNVLECLFWGDGVVAMTSDMQIFVAEGTAHIDALNSTRKYKLRTGLTANIPYTSMAIVPPLLSRSGLLEVLLGTEDSSIIVVNENGAEDQHLQDRIGAPILKMAVAPNGRFLACHQRDGVLTVMSTTFTTKVLDFDTKSTTRPLEITWCGEDAVVLVWRNTGLVMVGPYGDWLNFQYDGAVRLIPEADCCRVITSSSCEILQRVPASTVAIRRIGSTDPGALIYDAMEGFEEGDPKSGENIRSIAASDQLIGAIKSCITAAASEFDISKQQNLMRAASYGKSFSADADPTEFVETARKLRVLNEIRKPEIGMPLTMHQLNRLTLDVLISRLAARNHHFLALRICELLKLKNENVLTHWGCEKIYKLAGSSLSDESIRNTLQEKLLPYGSISYLEMATAAYQKGRRRLATMILDIVQNPVDQIPLLLSMQEEELALQKAVNSEDTDLMYLTLIHVERTRTDYETFYRLVCSHSEAANLLKLFYLSKVTPIDRMVLHKLLIFNKNFLEAGALAVRQSYAQPAEEKEKKIKLLKEAAHIFSQNRDLGALKTATEDQVDLIESQKLLEARTQNTFIDLSLTETLQKLIEMGVRTIADAAQWDAEIAKLVKRHKVSDKHLWRLKVQSLCRLGAHTLLSKLAADKKSPIGFKPFAVACIKYKLPVSETEKYIDRMTEADDRFELYMELSLYRKAADTAIKMKDAARLQEAGRMCRDPKLLSQVQEALTKLS